MSDVVTNGLNLAKNVFRGDCCIHWLSWRRSGFEVDHAP